MALLISYTLFVYQMDRHSDPQTVPEEKKIVHLAATGDILMHNMVIDSGRLSTGYHYDHLFLPIKHILKDADYASVCLEAALAGPESGYTGYPAFNAPDETAAALKNSGFGLIATASNHSLDRGYKGALRTIKILNEAGLDTVGTYAGWPQQKNGALIKDIDGVKIGYLAYTYSTNGLPVPEGHEYLVNYLDQETVLADIKRTRPQVDVLILILHWGVEYSPYPTEQQQKMAAIFFAHGADAILGSHPHVLQPYEIMMINGKKHFVIYSMGNSVGNQRGLERNSGVIVELFFEKDFSSAQTVLSDFRLTPTYCHTYQAQGKRCFRMIPIEETIIAIEKGEEPYLQRQDLPLLKNILKVSTQHLNSLEKTNTQS
ncbi:MAG TPA: CapA family protein [Syntrophomonadaceae bacterium]|nr:CapA family protein [Syntrophomonadaceae bacterium]